MERPMQYSIKELRARKGVTQREAASDLGVSLTTYNYWESHVSSLKVSTIFRLAEYYGVDARDIFLGDNMT